MIVVLQLNMFKPNSIGSSEIALMHGFAWTFAGRICYNAFFLWPSSYVVMQVRFMLDEH